MSLGCKICGNVLHESPDPLVMCRHRDGPVHLGCCIDNCSQDKKPCGHAMSVYEKL